MSKTEQIREAFERNRKAMELRPAIARGTATTTCRTIDGLTCEVTDGTRAVCSLPVCHLELDRALVAERRVPPDRPTA